MIQPSTSSRIKELGTKALWVAAYAFLLALIAFLPRHYEFRIESDVAIVVIVALIENSLAYFQKYISLFFARKLLTMSVMVGTIIITAAVLLPSSITPLNLRSPQVLIAIVQFGLQGFVVGIAIRELLLNMSLNNLFGQLIYIQRLLFLSGIVIFLFLMPLNPDHKGYPPFYLLGFGAGLSAHFLLRRLSQKGARASRQGKLLLSMLLDEKSVAALSEAEQFAIRYFVNGSWKKLHDLYMKELEDKTTLSTRLAIIESCRCRVKGEYKRALVTIDKAAANEKDDPYLYGLLLLQEALVRNDLGERDEMYRALNQSLERNPTCFLSKLLLGLCLAEDLPLERTNKVSEAELQRPVSLIREAMHINAHGRHAELLSNIIGRSVPLSWGVIQDTYGYALLKAGDYTFSKSLFLDSIRKEPQGASAYLHLGEWYLSYCINRKESKDRLILAKLCFSIAQSLGGKKGRIRDRAGVLLRQADDRLRART
jgi:tetratricopeptide (TPR) repeat protein